MRALAGVGAIFLMLTLVKASEMSEAKDQREFDYFMFVRQWAGSSCHTDGSCPLVHRHGFHLTIHGLWPNYDDGSYPQFCDNSARFDENKISDILDELEEEWPTIYNKEDDFWSHEYLKHGTCAVKVTPDEHSYFDTVLRLHYKYDLTAALTDAGIQPSDSLQYKRTDIEEAIREAYGVDVLVHCDAQHHLSEIWMCVGRDLKPFNCKAGPERCATVTIPTMSKTPGSTEDFPASTTSSQDQQAADPQVQPQAQPQHASSSGSSHQEGSELLRTIIIACAGAMMAVIIVGTVVVSALKRAADCEHCCRGCHRQGGSSSLVEAVVDEEVQQGASSAVSLKAHHQVLEDMEAAASLKQPLL